VNSLFVELLTANSTNDLGKFHKGVLAQSQAPPSHMPHFGGVFN
jgi:hypothetical protein